MKLLAGENERLYRRLAAGPKPDEVHAGSHAPARLIGGVPRGHVHSRLEHAIDESMDHASRRVMNGNGHSAALRKVKTERRGQGERVGSAEESRFRVAVAYTARGFGVIERSHIRSRSVRILG